MAPRSSEGRWARHTVVPPRAARFDPLVDLRASASCVLDHGGGAQPRQRPSPRHAPNPIPISADGVEPTRGHPLPRQSPPRSMSMSPLLVAVCVFVTSPPAWITATLEPPTATARTYIVSRSGSSSTDSSASSSSEASMISPSFVVLVYLTGPATTGCTCLTLSRQARMPRRRVRDSRTRRAHYSPNCAKSRD